MLQSERPSSCLFLSYRNISNASNEPRAAATDAEARKVLLILDGLVDRQESVELRVGEPEQRPVLDTRPAHVLNSLGVMAVAKAWPKQLRSETQLVAAILPATQKFPITWS